MDARLSAVHNGVVRVEFRYPAHLELMQRPANKEALQRAVHEVFGEEARVELAAGEKPASPSSPPAKGPSLADDPLVKEAMNRFDAVNVRVTPKGRT
jgi:hypothetical protein